MDEPDWQRLAQAVKDRRLALGLSTRAAAAAAAINRGTWGSIEEEERRLSDHLWSRVERALGWTPGSVEAILRGGEPTLVRAEAPATGRRLPANFNLREEYGRVRELPVSWETKYTIIGEVIDMYEQEKAEQQQQPGKEARSA